MDEKDLKTLDSAGLEILEKLEANDILPHLVVCNVISCDDCENIETLVLPTSNRLQTFGSLCITSYVYRILGDCRTPRKLPHSWK